MIEVGYVTATVLEAFFYGGSIVVLVLVGVLVYNERYKR